MFTELSSKVFKWSYSILLTCGFLNNGCSLHEPLVEMPPTPSDQIIIDYRREGGILPLTDEWRLFSDGRFQGLDDKIYRLDKETYLNLLQTCKRIAKSYSSPPDQTCADCYSVTLKLNCDGKMKTISAIEGKPGTPVYIIELLTTIRRTISTRKPVP